MRWSRPTRPFSSVSTPTISCTPTPTGRSTPRRRSSNAIKAGKAKYLSVERSDVKVQDYGDTQIVTFRAVIKVNAVTLAVAHDPRLRQAEWRVGGWRPTSRPACRINAMTPRTKNRNEASHRPGAGLVLALRCQVALFIAAGAQRKCTLRAAAARASTLRRPSRNCPSPTRRSTTASTSARWCSTMARRAPP
jgi:hypothetical protein